MNREDKKIQKAIDENLKPQKSFAEWAKEHDVELTPVNLQPGGAAYGRHEEKANGSSKIVVRRTISAVIAYSVIVAIFVSLIAVSVIMLPNNDVKHYQQSDTVSVLSSLDEAADYPGMLLFDTSSLYQMTSVFRQVAKDDESVTLAYLFSDCVFVYGDPETNPYVINATYIVRTHPGYEFMGLSDYDSLPDSVSISDVEMKYRFNDEEANVNVRFAYGDFEYFLEISGMPGVTELTESRVICVLAKLFCSNFADCKVDLMCGTSPAFNG